MALRSRYQTRQPSPDLKVEIDFSDRKIDLIEDGFDIALRIGTLTDSSLIARKVTSVSHTVAASSAFWTKHGRPEHPNDLSKLPALRYLNLKTPGGVRKAPRALCIHPSAS